MLLMALGRAAIALFALIVPPRGPPAWRLAMVAREGRMLARLGAGHINIVRPLEIVLTSRHVAFITEYVPGNGPEGLPTFTVKVTYRRVPLSDIGLLFVVCCSCTEQFNPHPCTGCCSRHYLGCVGCCTL